MMKKQTLLILILVLMPVCLFAHAPKSVNISYSSEAGILKIEIPHPVKNVSSHYIDKIEITVDGKEIKVVDYTEQSSLASHIVELELSDIKAGAEIEVNASCNKMGAKKGKYTVE